MAGRNQHYLPQFLQKGFTSKTSGKDRYTWLYRKGDAPIEEKIRRIGAEPFFYGDPDNEVSADPTITEVENPFAMLLDSLRHGAPGTLLQDHRIPLLVGHLAVRTKYVQEAARNAGANLITALGTQFPDLASVQNMLFLPENVERILERSTNWHSYSETIHEILRGVYKDYIVRNLPEYHRRWLEFLRAKTELANSQLRDALRGKINERLAESVSPDAVAQRYQGCQWMVLETLDNLILGDTACVVEREDGSYRGFDNSDISTRNIFLPITSNRILAASSGPSLSVEAATLNEAAARSSYEFFISAERDAGFDLLHARIGETAEILSKEEAQELIKQLFLETIGEYMKNYGNIGKG